MTERGTLLQAQLITEAEWLEAGEICRVCRLELHTLVELAESGLVAPRGRAPEHWQLPARDVPLLRVAARLIRDLGVNASGAALAMELLETQRALEARLRELERLIGS